MPESKPEFCMEDWPARVRHRRSGREAVLDRCRKLLVPATPEEEVRQRFVDYLIEHLGFPETSVFTEVSLAHWARGKRGRADIVVAPVDSETGQRFAVLIVECKAPHLPLVNDHVEQLLRYDEAIQTDTGLLVLTNGTKSVWYLRGDDSLQILIEPASFADIFGGGEPVFRDPQPAIARPPFGDTGAIATDRMLEAGALGEGSSKSHFEFLFNLGGLLHFAPGPTYAGTFRDYTFVDLGDRYTSFGNASGGRWTGFYRYFVVRSSSGDTQIVSISMLGAARRRAGGGKTRAHTMLIVAVDDFERRHNSLQLNLDRFARTRGDQVALWHDGTLTRGKQGRAKTAHVRRFVRSAAPHLMQGDEVVLGRIPANRQVTWADLRPLVENLIEYALVRDAFRSSQ